MDNLTAAGMAGAYGTHRMNQWEYLNEMQVLVRLFDEKSTPALSEKARKDIRKRIETLAALLNKEEPKKEE